MPFSRVILAVSVASEYLYTFHRGPHGHVGGVHLCHRRFLFEVIAVILQPGGLEQEHLRRVQLGCHIGKFPLDCLKRCDRLSELHSFLCIRERIFKHRPAYAERLAADAYPAGVETFHHLAQSLSRFSQEISGWHFSVFKDQLRRPGRQYAHLLLYSADGKTGGVFQIYNEIDNSFVTF